MPLEAPTKTPVKTPLVTPQEEPGPEPMRPDRLCPAQKEHITRTTEPFFPE